MNKAEATSSIVIGDVGSGKTAVEIVVSLAYLVSMQKSQVVLLAPTEVLARQHYDTLWVFVSTLDGVDFSLVFTGGKKFVVNNIELKKSEFELIFEKSNLDAKKLKKREEVIAKTGIKNLDKIYWVGTHAVLFNEAVQADLVIVDEQHRFGVKQRSQLSRENQGAHYISFTATPIPRTLALAIYDDLQPLFLQKISSRSNIETSVIRSKDEATIVEKLKEHIANGHKCYVVCPRVEDKEEGDDDMWSVHKMQKFLHKHFDKSEVLMTHGREKDKSKKLLEFKTDETKKILISTTVIEVGVDVAEATLMVIMNAERFGLAALHQIRGRVGRNDYETNECLLAAATTSSTRLRFMCGTNDGFKIAEKDLELRGSGQILGNAQSGFGAEVDELIGLDMGMYTGISQMVNELDFDSKELRRLKNYAEDQVSQIWGE